MVQRKNFFAQYGDCFSPHPGLTFNFREREIIGNNGETVKATIMQNRFLEYLSSRKKDGLQGGWATWDDLERLTRSKDRKWEWNEKTKKAEKRKRTPEERIDHIQKAMHPIRKLIRRVHPCKVVIEYGEYYGIPAYRLTSSDACTLVRNRTQGTGC